MLPDVTQHLATTTTLPAQHMLMAASVLQDSVRYTHTQRHKLNK